ncbi:multifunctional 2',3'-cyclic-nucleotide 2'-phosphodiesterase/5'-nucleotidase/3'-nucleotidase [Paenibacillus selenitireducens]|uniref:Multifunctional 2',3'-cyclic-nucleotide 2'-phosphodiesterase/5'-nucleotidase/3'-nucleotidase n=2 Tax=Paenibacillus selenitireducens TaxID=1324314 RepID=A0A1T2XNT5_9BACL|nr:multifunctional 2',3'-cyclic-nucleotide 2'-phosphodiesterase/5'-nucleotidase/3'-nucleotidase [Paenibacillus selenitireducens]
MAMELTLGSLFSSGMAFASEGERLAPGISVEQTIQEKTLAAEEFGISTLTLPNATAGSDYSVTMEVYGGQAPYTYSAVGLPIGLEMNSATGEIAGIPLEGADVPYPVELIVRDAADPMHTANAHVKLKVDKAPAAKREDKLEVEMIAHYTVGASNKDGGVAEIVKYNKDNGKFYLVNGATKPASLDIVTLHTSGELQRDKQIQVEALVNGSDFTYGDLTSVDINTATNRIAAAVQEADPTKAGKIVVLDYEGNLLHTYEAGIQPDMIKFTSDGRYMMTADEGEPRTPDAPDPEGSVTIVDTLTNEVTHLKFNQPELIDDLVHLRGKSDAAGQITAPGSKADAVYDLEPEFISLSKDEKTAYVAMQENNAIAVIDIPSKSVIGVHGLGYKDFSKPGNELDLLKDNSIHLEQVPFYGMYMPDGIATYEVNGQTYLLSANEGDATAWPGRTNESKIKDMKGKLNPDSEAAKFLADKGTKYDKVEVASDMGPDGLYMYGARSFSIWNADQMSLVYDSGSDFEEITAERLPDYFNSSNDKVELDSRSAKKGPEPEYVAVGKVGEKTLAFVGLERIGGVMTYDVTNPMQPQFMNYTNTRNFQAGISSDSGPEGLEFISAADSPTGRPLLLVANEVSGTVSVLEMKVSKVTLDHSSLELEAGAENVHVQAVVEPAVGSGTSVKWSSSNEQVAGVDQAGWITPRTAGEAIITATSEDGYGLAQVKVTVTDDGAGEKPWKLTVMHTNDTHAHLGDVARRVSLVNQVRSEGGNQLLLDAGDVFSGDLYFTKWLGLADLAFMNMMGYDAMTFGNHEFDQGTKVLADFVSKAHFPLISSNVDVSKDRHLFPLMKDATTIRTQDPKSTEQAGIYPYVTLDVNGQKVGVFGLTTEDTAETSSPGKDVTFHNAVASAKETVKAMENEGLKIIIGVTHIGYARDKELAQAVEGIDLIVGGHTHTTLNAPEIVVDREHNTPTVIVQANEWGKFLGRVDLAFDSNGVVLTEQVNGRLVPVDAKVEEDPQAKALLDPYKQELQEMMNEVVGVSSIVLDGERKNVRSKETNLGNLIAEGMLAKAKELKQADIALMNGGGIRASIDQGEITMGELRTVMPFGNTLFVLDVTGKQLKEGLENGISGAKLADLPGKFPQVAGMTFKWDPNQPAGERVYDIQIKKGSSYVPLDLEATYRMATNSFVAKGGDGYRSFAEAIEQGHYNEDLGYPDYEIFIQHVARLGGTVSPMVDGRIKEQAKGQTGGDNGSGSGSGSGGGPGSSSGTTPTGSNGTSSALAHIITIDQLQLASLKNEAGEVIHQVTMKDEVLKKAINALSAKQQEVIIQAAQLEGHVEVILPAAILGLAADKNKDALLVVETNLASYRLPIDALPLAKLKQDGGLEKAKIVLSIKKAQQQVLDKLKSETDAWGAKLVGGVATAFTLSIAQDKNIQEIKDFDRRYVSRILPLPSEASSSAVTAVKVDEATGKFIFVPAVRTTLNGKPAWMLKHTGNGVFAMIQYTASFADLKGHWAKAEVESLASKWLVKGKSATNFAPNEAITRGEYTALLVRALGLAPSNEATKYVDVSARHTFAGEIAAAERLGMLDAAKETQFRPEASVTRAEIAVMTAQAIQAASQDATAKASLQSFKDASAVPTWAVDAMSQLVELHIVQGNQNGELVPNEAVTRAQAVLVMSRMLKELKFID